MLSLKSSSVRIKALIAACAFLTFTDVLAALAPLADNLAASAVTLAAVPAPNVSNEVASNQQTSIAT